MKRAILRRSILVIIFVGFFGVSMAPFLMEYRLRSIVKNAFTEPLFDERIIQQVNELVHVWGERDVVLPPEALRVTPYSSELYEAAGEFHEQFLIHKTEMIDLHMKYHFWTWNPEDGPPESGALTNPDFKIDCSVFDSIAPIIPAYRKLTQSEGFVQGAQVSSADLQKGLPFSVEPEPAATQILWHLLILKAIALDQTGDYAAAADLINLASTFVVTSEFEYGVSRMIAPRALDDLLEYWAFSLSNDPGPEQLTLMLNTQNRMTEYPRLFPMEFANLESGYLHRDIALLREFKRRGVDFDLKPMTGRELSVMTYRLLLDHYDSSLAAHADDVEFVSSFDGIVEQTRSFYSYIVGMEGTLPFWRWRDRRREIGAILLKTAMYTYHDFPDDWERVQYKEIAVRLDLTRIATASRLYGLDKGKSPNSINDLVPDYLPSTPIDPFGADDVPYIEGSVVYSVGPDADDDDANIPYIADEQLLHAPFADGDIWLDLFIPKH